MKRFHRLLILPLLVTLLIPAACSSPTTTTEQAKPAETTTTPAPKPTPVKPTVSDEDIQLAIRAEQVMRNWGSDSLISVNGLSRQDATSVLNQLKGSIPDKNPLTNLVDASLFTTSMGPDASSPFCQDDDTTMTCSTMPRMRDWWPHQAWAYGTRWVTTPQATISNDTILITGTVRSILLQDDDTYQAGEYHALTPAWQDYPIKDQITVRNGKIVKIISLESNYWWTNPWLTEWDRSMPDNVSEGTRIAIPVKGTPNMGLQHDGRTRIVKGPASQADLNGRVDWHLWDNLGVIGQSSDGTCQNPVACN